jgi:hypothetical protein
MLKFTLSKGICPVVFVLDEKPCIVSAGVVNIRTAHQLMSTMLDMKEYQWIIHSDEAQEQLEKSFVAVTVNELKEAHQRNVKIPDRRTSLYWR